MDIVEETIQDLLNNHKCNDLDSLLDCLNTILYNKTNSIDLVTSDLIDSDFLEEIRNIVSHGVPIYFGKTLRDLKCIVVDDGMRKHEICLRYKGPRRIAVVLVQLPHSPLLDQEYSSIEDIVRNFKVHVEALAGYLYELERIDRFCTVVEPVNPTFLDNYRRIMLDDRIWLHVEVTPEGLATNVHLVGHSEQWQAKLQAGLLNWNHDEDIIENVMTIFDMPEFPVPTNKSMSACPELEVTPAVEVTLCTICLCPELPGLGVPQPLCQNTVCGVYFHRNCLFQWLVACAGGRPPAFCVATGSCPTCFQPIACSERDN